MRNARLRPVGLLLLVWWAYLVLPRTLLFTWYIPLLVLPAYVLAALGLNALCAPTGAQRLPRLRPEWAPAAVAMVGVILIGGLGSSLFTWRATQYAEVHVRRAIGTWLLENTPADAQIAMEPIGYIGYYSHRHILDEVGLVSPEMVALNRKGAAVSEAVPFILLDDDDFADMMELNLFGAFRMCRAAVRGMIRQKHGRIVNISSITGRRPSIAAPIPMPINPASLIGVSTRRLSPYFFQRPSVTL